MIYAKIHTQSLSCVLHFAAPRTVAHQAPLSMAFPRQEYWSHFLFQGIFPTQGSNLNVLHLLNWRVDSLPAEPLEEHTHKHT